MAAAERGPDDETAFNADSVADLTIGVVGSLDGHRLYIAQQGGDRLAILDIATLEIVQTPSVADHPSGLALTDCGRPAGRAAGIVRML